MTLALEGIRVIDLTRLLPGPFGSMMLADMGAEVIKVEETEDRGELGRDVLTPPAPSREEEEKAAAYNFLGRNKKSLALNLKHSEAKDIFYRLAETSDVVFESYRPGIAKRLGIDYETISKLNPRIVFCSISGYGQDGPYASKSGFASVCEGFGGLRYVNGFPGEAPVRPNLSIGDTLAGLHAVIGILLACVHRMKSPENSGQVIDTALFEAVFNLMEGVVPEYDGGGVIREPSGSTITGIVPTNTYSCADGKFIIIGANGDSIFKRLCEKMDRPEMADDPRLADNAGRVEHEAEIDAVIAQWTGSLDSATALQLLEEARVPSGPIYSVEDMMADEHYQARGLFEEVDVGGSKLKIPALVPKLSETPGRTDWAGPEVGAFNDEIYGELLNLSKDKIAELKIQGVI